MKIIRVSLVFLGVFLTCASAQPPYPNSGGNRFPGPPSFVVEHTNQAIQAYPATVQPPAAVVDIPPPLSGLDLLRTVKALAESGHADNPDAIVELFHVKFTETDHAVSNGTGRGGCSAGGSQVTDSYGVTGFAARISYAVHGALRCDNPNQNEVTTVIDFDNIRANACISKGQIQSIFPKLGPGDSVADPLWMWGNWRSDFTYSVPGARISFLITPRLMWYPEPIPMRLPNGKYIMRFPPTPAQNGQPLCLIAMSLSRQSHFGPSHVPDFSYRPPTDSRVGVVPSSPSYQTPPSDPGLFLLRSVKALADSGRADNPGIVAGLLHVSLAPNNYSNHIATSCSATPDFRNFVSINYYMTSKSWFHSLPTGQRVSKGGVAVHGDTIVITSVPAGYGDPIFNYSVSGEEDCNRLSKGLVVASLDFWNIPAYACISESQIISIFPGAHPVPSGGGLPAGIDFEEGADLRYSKTISVSDGNMLTDAIVDFGMLSSLPEGLKPHQPNCLAGIEIHGYYREGAMHKLDLGD